jgi:L-lactate dehydrogenase complex protein LldG
MSAAKESILGRIRDTLISASEAAPIHYAYHQQSDSNRLEILAEFVRKVRDYQAIVTEGTEADLPAAMAVACQRHALQRLAIPDDLPSKWVPSEIETLPDTPPLSNDDLDHCDGVLTGCAIAIAQTGTIILDGGKRQGRRALSLVPDVHICVVRADQVVGVVPEAITWLRQHPTRPITFISGPSATSDIELARVEGVHGPRTLIVYLLSHDREMTKKER